MNTVVKTYVDGRMVKRNTYQLENLESAIYYVTSNYSSLNFDYSSVKGKTEKFIFSNYDASYSVVMTFTHS